MLNMRRVISFLLLNHICEFRNITGTDTSVWLNLGFHSILMTVPMADERNWKKKKQIQETNKQIRMF